MVLVDHMQDSVIQTLQRRLKDPLPGKTAQFKMASAVRQEITPPEDARRAGVLALLYPKQQEWHICLIQRVSSNPNDRHKGQISFPGGRYDDEDGTLEQTAIREAYEEVGVLPQEVNILGPLTQLYIPVSNFLVDPFVGFTNNRPEFIPQPTEVADILEVPLAQFQDPATIQQIDLELAPQLILRDVPHYAIQGKVVWGATAMMISELMEMLE